MDDATTELPSANPAETVGPGAAPTAALYLRVAETLERSASLAEHHAERLRDKQQEELASVELERAKRAREAARRGRALASSLGASPRSP